MTFRDEDLARSLLRTSTRRTLTLAPLPMLAESIALSTHAPAKPDPFTRKSRLILQRILAALALAAGAGAVLALWLSSQQLGNPDPRDWNNVFFVLFARNEPIGLALVFAFTAMALLWFRRGAPGIALSFPPKTRLAVDLLSLAVFLIAALGTGLVFHQYALTADENMADFQARIFLSGKIYQSIPEFWEPLVRFVMPTHGAYLSTAHSWMSSYLPAYAAIRAGFMSIGLQWLTNPVFAAISIIAIAAVARNIWPNDRWKPLLAAGLLAASPQFLVMSMTSYAMPAHLALNLVWLWLYSDPGKRRFWLAPFLGVVALGLHQPFFHALFAAPFLLRLIRDRRWKTCFWFGAIYIAGIASWYAWWHYFLPAFSAGGSKGPFGLHGQTLLVQIIYASLLLGWVALPVPLLAVLGFGGLKKAPPLLCDIATSCLLTFGLYIFVRLNQAHGWGDRYFHGALGCLILVAAAGWDSLSARIGRQAAVTFALVGLVVAFFVQLPLRSVQAEQFVRPYARAAEFFRTVDADVVVFDPRLAWYANDLKRNDPLWQSRPMIISTLRMTEEQIEAVQQHYPNGRLISREELAAFELVTEPYR